MEKITKIILIGGFFAIIFGFFIVSVLTPDRKISTIENRFLAVYPEISRSGLISGEFFKNFETYFTDQIVGRDQFVQSYIGSELMQNKVQINNVVIGGNDWLFTPPDAELREERIDYTIRILEKFMEQKPEDVEVFMSMVPHKLNILQHEIPSYFDHNYGYDNAKYLMENVPESMHVLDVQKQFLEDFSEDQLSGFYFKTDHHWNIDGAFEAYKRTIGFMDQELEGFDEQPLEEAGLARACLKGKNFIGSLNQQLYLPFPTDTEEMCYYKPPMEKVVVEHEEKDLSKIYGAGIGAQDIKYATLYAGDYSILEFENTDVNNDLHLVVLKDSYANAVLPFIAEHFRKTTVLDLRYYEEQSVLSFLRKNDVDALLMFYNNTNLFGPVYEQGLGVE